MFNLLGGVRMKIKSWMLMLIASGWFPLAMVLIIECDCEETMNLVYRKNKVIKKYKL